MGLLLLPLYFSSRLLYFLNVILKQLDLAFEYIDLKRQLYCTLLIDTFCVEHLVHSCCC